MDRIWIARAHDSWKREGRPMRRRWLIVTIVAALIALMSLPAASAASGGTHRPFRAALAGEVTFEFPGVSPSDCTIVTTKTHAMGNATHMGLVESYWSHCPAEVDYVGDGRMILIAANGDELYGFYDYFELAGAPVLTAIALDGGTGRFADATGEITADFVAVPQFIDGCGDPTSIDCLDFTVPWPWWATLAGSIST